MIRVCDSIMGSGKSQSVITLMNENPDKRYIYITPYLEEAARIKEGCPKLNFIEPSNKINSFKYSKLEHTKSLIQQGMNITTTHAAFKSYSNDLVQTIKDGEYTLIIDEAVNIFERANCNSGDIELLVRAGYLKHSNGLYEPTELEYTGKKFKDYYDMFRCNNMIYVKNEKNNSDGSYYYWAIPHSIMSSFKDVYVLTYMFDSQDMRCYFNIFGLKYQKIGISYENGIYRFCDEKDRYTPDYVSNIYDMIHIFDNDKINEIGKNKYSLSANWMKVNTKGRDQLRKNVYNYIRNYSKCKSSDIMWGTYNSGVRHIKGKGYAERHVVFNMKATNEYRDKTVLAYCANVFTDPFKINFFKEYGVDYNDDSHALSTMIQWIWRSAIRDGRPISIYIPSKRMRDLLIGWMDSISGGGQ